MGPAGIFSTSTFAVLAFTTTAALAAASKTTSTTTSLILPSITTSADERIYATLISGGEDQDVYSLDCQSDFKASRTCSGAFAGRTLTYGPATVRFDLGGPQGTYDCARGGPADADTGPLTCRASAGAGGTFSATATLDEASRATPVTVLGQTGKARAKARPRTTTMTTDGRTITTTIVPAATGTGTDTTTTTKPAAAAGGACKRDLHPRKVGNHGSGGGDASSGSDAGSAAAGSAGTVKPDGEDEGDDGTTTSGSRRKDAGCSAGSRVDGVEWLGGLLGLGVLVLAFAI